MGKDNVEWQMQLHNPVMNALAGLFVEHGLSSYLLILLARPDQWKDRIPYKVNKATKECKKYNEGNYFLLRPFGVQSHFVSFT